MYKQLVPFSCLKEEPFFVVDPDLMVVVVVEEEELFVLEWEQLVLPLEGLVELGYFPMVELVIV